MTNPPVANVPPNALSMEDFRRTCRLCFLRDQQLQDCFLVEELPRKIEHCLGITIFREDFPGTFVCTRCITLLNHFDHFKQLCLGYEQTFREIIRNHRETIPTYPPMVVIKPEPLEQIELEPLEVKQEPDSFNEELEPIPSTSSYIPASSGTVAQNFLRPLAVHMIYQNNRFACARVQPSGVIQWDCSWFDCGVSYNCIADGTLSLRFSKTHNHPDQVPTVGMIHCMKSGQLEWFAIDDVLGQGRMKLVWNDHDWFLEDGVGDERKAVCVQGGCPKHLRIVGDFQQLEDFNEHNHAKSLFLIRTEEKPCQGDLNIWNHFLRINPCKLPLPSELETPLRMKLFHNRQQYRLCDCSWDGSSRWRCDTTSCQALLVLSQDGCSVDVKKHSHDVQAERHGIFNGRYFFAMMAYSGVKKIFYDGHCYNSTTTKDAALYPWTCALYKGYNIVCHAKLHVGPDYETLELKGKHSHAGYGAIVKPWEMRAIYLSEDNPTMPPFITVQDLQAIEPKTKPTSIPCNAPTPQPSSSSPPKPRKPSKRIRNLNDHPAGAEVPLEPLRMVYDGHRYTMVEFFPDGTCFWRCWGYTCRKLLHISPEGTIYTRKDNVEHSHPPCISMVGEVAIDGVSERFAVFDDVGSCTMMVFRNALWSVLPGDGCFIATCREIAVVGTERQTCGAKIRIQIGYGKFEFITGRCCGHGAELQYLIRRSAEPEQGDPIVWEVYRKKYPFYMSDGSVLDESRYLHMFVGGFRYTNQSLLWTGGSLLRCAAQKCPAKGKLLTSGLFVAPTHPHDVAEHMQGTIWSVKRQKQERFFVHITQKKTMATLHFNSYSYALRDEQRNVWCCYPDSCNAFVRIEGDFESVVEESEHTHDGTLTVIRDDETPESELTLPPVKGCRKRSHVEEVRVSADIDAVSVSPKLAGICQLLVKKTTRPLEPVVRSHPLVYHHGGHTYNKLTIQPDGCTRLECIKFRCPGRVILNKQDQSVLSSTDHSHPKSFNSCGSILDVANGQTLLYILVNGTQKKNVTYFVCNGFRYSCMTKGSIREANSEWMCSRCSVRIMLSDGLATIEHNSTHDHDSTDLIIPGGQDAEPASDSLQPPSSWDEVIFGDHRYTASIQFRRKNKIKWQCHRRKDCKGSILQDTDGTFEIAAPHDHEGPVQYLGEARFDHALKIKDRYAILKAGERPKLRTLIFQNQKYYEGNNGFAWVCVRKLCSGKLVATDNYEMLTLVEGHCHQPTNTAIKFHGESGTS